MAAPSRRAVDLLRQLRCTQLVDSSGAAVVGATAFQILEMVPFRLGAGWWRVMVDADFGPVILELWGADSGDFASLTLTPGRRHHFRCSGGIIEASLCLGALTGKAQIKSFRLEPVGKIQLFSELMTRACRVFATCDVRRIGRALTAVLDRTIPITLSEATQTLPELTHRPARRPSPLSIVVYVDGFSLGDRQVTLKSLAAQRGVQWRLAVAEVEEGDLSLRLLAGDTLSTDALALLAGPFDDAAVEAVYADASFAAGLTAKPEWDAELAAHYDYVSRPVMWRGAHAPTPAEQESALRDLAGKSDAAIVRLPLVLLETDARPPPLPRVRPAPAVEPVRISILTPTRDRPELIGTFLANVLDKTVYDDLELILIDNGTQDPEALRLIEARAEDPRVRILRIDAPFNYAALNNAGERLATGDLLVFLNNDVEPLEGGWLADLAKTAMRPEVGAVGPLLLYPDRTVQHAGVALGIGGVAGHPWKGMQLADVDRLAHLAFPQQRSALTAACLAVRRPVFLAAGGFDEVRFPVTLNDIDLCLRISDLQLRLVYDPRVRLIHHESRSRPSDRERGQRARVIAEQNAFRSIWRSRIAADPFYAPALTRGDETGRRRL